MKEDDLKVFIESASRYFGQTFREDVIVDPPYLREQKDFVQEYAGLIGVSGQHKGMIYFTADGAMLREMLTTLGDTHPGAEADMIGEIANTVSGNARKSFGAEFHISVPVVLQGAQSSVAFPSQVKPFVIPMVWRRHRCHLIIGFEP